MEIELPYTFVKKIFQKYEQTLEDDIIRTLIKESNNMVNDVYITNACLYVNPLVLAVGVIELIT